MECGSISVWQPTDVATTLWFTKCHKNDNCCITLIIPIANCLFSQNNMQHFAIFDHSMGALLTPICIAACKQCVHISMTASSLVYIYMCSYVYKRLYLSIFVHQFFDTLWTVLALLRKWASVNNYLNLGHLYFQQNCGLIKNNP